MKITSVPDHKDKCYLKRWIENKITIFFHMCTQKLVPTYLFVFHITYFQT